MKIGAGFLGLAFKILPKIFLFIVKFIKGMKVGQVGLMAASVAAYSYFFTWQFALAIVAGILIHELGHVWAMKRYKMKVKGIYFIPFLGAAAVADNQFKTRWIEAYVALMGPIWGFAVSAVFAAVYILTDNPLWAALAGVNSFLNIINLLPINPLDGGRIIKSIAFSLHSRVGYALLIVSMIGALLIAIKAGLWLFVIIGALGILDLFFEAKEEKSIPKPKMDPRQIAMIVIISLALIIILWLLIVLMQHVPEVEVAKQFLME